MKEVHPEAGASEPGKGLEKPCVIGGRGASPQTEMNREAQHLGTSAGSEEQGPGPAHGEPCASCLAHTPCPTGSSGIRGVNEETVILIKSSLC